MADDLAAFRRRLAERRRRGEPFDEAWEAELSRLPATRWDRRDYPTSAALRACRSAWERAYLREPPTSLDGSAGRLAGALEAAAGRGASRGPRHPESRVLA